MKNMFLQIGRFEGGSLLLLLFIAMPLKYLAERPEAVRAVGSAHGLLFLLYVGAAFSMYRQCKWPVRTLLVCLILSSVPFGTFYFERKYVPN